MSHYSCGRVLRLWMREFANTLGPGRTGVRLLVGGSVRTNVRLQKGRSNGRGESQTNENGLCLQCSDEVVVSFVRNDAIENGEFGYSIIAHNLWAFSRLNTLCRPASRWRIDTTYITKS